MFFKTKMAGFISFVFFLTASMAFGGPAMPKELASEFTQYPGSTVVHTMAAEGMVQAILSCGKASMETVFEYYTKKAALTGWVVATKIQSADVYQLMLTKKDQSGMIAVTGEDGETSVVLSISQD